MNEPLKLQFTQGILDISSTQKEILGAPRWTADGRFFRYAKAGATVLAVGLMGQAVAPTAGHIERAPAADVAIGDTSLSIATATTAVVEDEYKDGFLQVNKGTGIGHQYRIESNTACAISGTTVVQLKDPIKVALTNAGSEVSLIRSLHYGVVETTTQEAMPAGIAPCAVTALYYYWAQTGGQAPCYTEGTDTVGNMMIQSNTKGMLEKCATTAVVSDRPIVGILLGTGVASEIKTVKLTLF